MIYERINIWNDCKSSIKTEATMDAYIPDNSPEIDTERLHKAVLICPGGGYHFTSDREAEPIALEFLSKGIAAFVLRYSVAPARYPTALLEVSRAMWIIRENANQWHINTNDIAVCGFSAGGHLAANLATQWNEKFISEKLGMPSEMNKPNKLILCYPVILSEKGRCHRGSFENLLGEGLSEEEYSSLSLEKLIGQHTPPTFLWHTFNDGAVPCDSSLEFALALKKHNIPFEMHIYPDGPHGLSLCDERTTKPASPTHPYIANWIQHCTKWMLTY